MRTPKGNKRSVKARKMYATTDANAYMKVYPNAGWTIDCTGKQVYLLKADRVSIEAMIARGAEAIAVRHGHPWGGCGDSTKHIFRDDAAAVLKAIGIALPSKPSP